MSEKRSDFKMHMGLALIRLAQSYPKLLDVILELVGNAIDAGAGKIRVLINQKSRVVEVADDGSGKTKTQFEDALKSVCVSMKASGTGIGRFGLGLISPLGKAKMFTFTSTTKNNPRGYLRWTFETETIKMQESLSGIPWEEAKDLIRSPFTPHRGEKRTACPWNTIVRIEDYVKDRMISRVTLDSLRDELLGRYSTSMRKNEVVVMVRIRTEDGQNEISRDIQAEPYSGEKLPEVVIEDSIAGKTTFRLFLAKRTEKGRKGKVAVGEQDDEFRVPFALFAKSAQLWLGSDIIACLNSGLLEGDILSEKAKLHVGRKGFEEDERLFGLCGAIEEWFTTCGKELYEKEKGEKKDNRFLESALRSLGLLKDIINNPDLSELRSVIEKFKLGTIGNGHKEPASGLVGSQGSPSISPDGCGGEAKGPHGGGPSKKSPKESPGKDKPGHLSGSVINDAGRVRRIVRNDSLGIQLVRDDMPDSDKPWALEAKSGVIRLNTRHPGYVCCESAGDDALDHYILNIMIHALVFQSLPGEWRETGMPRLVLDELVLPFAVATSFTKKQKKPGPPSKKKRG